MTALHEVRRGAVTFTECISPATPEQIAGLEAQLGFRLPEGLRRVFSEFNGGRPEPRTLRPPEGAEIRPYGPWDNDVSACLELRDGRGSALWSYQLEVLLQRLVPATFFPFAHCSGGDTYFVDCASPDGQVHVYVHDTAHEHLHALGVSIDAFWGCLTT